MNKDIIKISENEINKAYEVAQQIPEFENLYAFTEFNNRLSDVKSLILTAYYKNWPVGFKIGYETPSKKIFYSWIGGVLSNYRKRGIANELADYQEKWVTNKDFKSIIVKTRKKHTSMIAMLDSRAYKKLAILPCSPDEETRLIYEKVIQI